MATKEGLGIKAAARKSTARLGAHQAWSRRFPRRLNGKQLTRSVLLTLPDRPVLSEQWYMAACSCRRAPVAGNQRKRQTLECTSKRGLNPFSLGSSWFSPLVSELWLRVSLNDQALATFRTNNGSDQSSTHCPDRRRVKDCITQIER